MPPFSALFMDPALRKVADEGDVSSLIELVSVKPDIIYSKTDDKNTVLHIAVSKGYARFVHQVLLMSTKELILMKNNDGDAPLHLVAKGGHLELGVDMIQYLAWARNLQVATIMINKIGNTPLHEAVVHQMSEVALELLEANPGCSHVLNNNMQSPLHIAARKDLVRVVKKITDQGLAPSVSTNVTALHEAVLGDSIGSLEILLNNNVELVSLTDSSGSNALHRAVQNNKENMVSVLLTKESSIAYKKNNEQQTPLHVAAEYGSAVAARELLKQCPDTIEMVDSDGRKAFHIAIIHDKINMLDLLLKYDMVYLDGRNAFHIAIIHNKMSVLDFLLKYQLPDETLNQQDRDGNTPLHHAAQLRQGKSVLWLLNDRRINSLVINKDGHTAWDYQIPIELMAQRLSYAIDKGDVPSLVNILASDPNMVYSVTPNGEYTALHIAASKENDCMVHHVLLYTNRNVGFIISKNIDGDTPLHLAVRAGHLKVVHRLICYVAWAREIEVNLKFKEPLILQNKEGNTLLHEAVIHGLHFMADCLLDCAKEVTCTAAGKLIKEYGEYIDGAVIVSIYDILLVIRNGHWDTPLHLAIKMGDSEFVDMLIRHAKVMNLELTTQYLKGPIIMANKLGNTPLHIAVLQRRSDIALKLLEANPTCGHMLNAAMESPFYIAVRDGLIYVVKKIANQGLYVASTSTHGTALHQCVLGDNIRALEILLNRYEKLVELTDLSGNNALHYAAKLNNARMVSILLNKNSTLAYKQNDEKHTPLHTAAHCGSVEAAKELLKRFPDAIEMVDNVGRNALHIAAINDKANVLQLLLKYVLPEEFVNQQDVNGNTPLHHATKLFWRQSTLLLLNDRRVNTCLINQDGDTAFALSSRTGISDMNINEIKLWRKELKKHESRRQYKHKLKREHVFIHLFVTVLMSMATFAVTLTVPGGYSRQSGTAIVGHHPVFKIFIICNSISMCGSTAIVFYYILRKEYVKVKLKLTSLIWANMLVGLSGLTMIMSALTALYLTIAPASRLVVYVAVAIGACTTFLACWIYIPRKISRTEW